MINRVFSIEFPNISLFTFKIWSTWVPSLFLWCLAHLIFAENCSNFLNEDYIWFIKISTNIFLKCYDLNSLKWFSRLFVTGVDAKFFRKNFLPVSLVPNNERTVVTFINPKSLAQGRKRTHQDGKIEPRKTESERKYSVERETGKTGRSRRNRTN